VLVAPVEEELQKISAEITDTYATKVRVLLGDLEEPELPQEVFENLQREGIHVDILVNNADWLSREMVGNSHRAGHGDDPPEY
jgi:short-subunit dehydrogenase